MENYTTNEVKHLIECNLLDAMKSIDVAVYNISQHLGEHYAEITELYRIKSQIKSILNLHFDRLAYEKST